jgi:hypothetical protein
MVLAASGHDATGNSLAGDARGAVEEGRFAGPRERLAAV